MPKISINEIIDIQSSASASASGTPIAILGTATQGPVNSPTLINSYDAFISIFGNTAPNESEYPYGYFAAKECTFTGSPVLFTRIANAAVKASYTESSAVVELQANNEGTYANGYSVTFSAVDAPNQVYKAVVTNAAGKVVNSGNITAKKAEAISYTGDAPEGSIELGVVGGITISQKITVDESAHTYTPSDFYSVTTAAVTLSGGTNGADFVGGGMMTVIENVIKDLQDDTVYNYQVIATPGICNIKENDIKVWQVLSDLCNGTHYTDLQLDDTDSRVYILDADPQTSDYTKIIEDLGIKEDALLQTAIFYPWYIGTVVNTAGTYTLPPSIAYLRGFANSQKSGYPCTPVAGPGYGSIIRIDGIEERLGRVLCEKISDMGVNPITYHRTLGYFIDGNYIYNPKATGRTYKQLSIRQTVNYIKQRLNELCYSLSYGLNIPIIRTQFQGQAVALLDKLKVANYIYGYSVALSNNQAELAEGRISATVKIFPTSALEEFVINLQIVNSTESLD